MEIRLAEESKTDYQDIFSLYALKNSIGITG